jgi:hypothetical protein
MPVASIAVWLEPSPASQADNANRSFVADLKGALARHRTV